MTDQQLQLALAKMLPEKIYIINGLYRQFASWSPGGRIPVQDTEWLHVCWLVEQGLDAHERCLLTDELGGAINQTSFSLVHKSWQQRAEALIGVKGA